MTVCWPGSDLAGIADAPLRGIAPKEGPEYPVAPTGLQPFPRAVLRREAWKLPSPGLSLWELPGDALRSGSGAKS